MDAARWDRIQSIFKQVIDAPPVARDAQLDAACGDDPALRSEVLALLAADEATLSLLDGVAADAIEVQDDFALEGQRVGPYRLHRLLATGGMGAVYLAHDEERGLPGNVALKLVRQGMDTARILQRFEREREILARLRHPNIARLLEAGTTESGKPWFALEYVDGEAIDRFCDRHRLSIDARLRLFAAVCEAVHHAHVNDVVHRDLKPANILVAHAPSGAPDVKLLDFGIAKALGIGAVDLTRTGGQVMTPAYASPEQIRGERVTTATDVYSLGIVLFELLTGQLPYAMRGESRLEIASMVVKEEVPKPSSVVSWGHDPVAAAKARATDPEHLRLRLSGHLDAVCLTALRKEPEERYASVRVLADEAVRGAGGGKFVAGSSS
ncbi:MAG TPA: serine/threonine-protein kinase [Rhodothermales bacterium]